MPSGPRHRGRPFTGIQLFEADVRDGFDPATFQRGDNYQRRGKVLEDATALFDPNAAGPLTFTEDDLAVLFQPI